MLTLSGLLSLTMKTETITQRLLALPQQTIAPTWAIQFALAKRSNRNLRQRVGAVREQLAAESGNVNSLAERLGNVAPTWPTQTVGLL